MAIQFTLLIFLAHLLAFNCEEQLVGVADEQDSGDHIKPSYSFSYGVSDVNTGDIKTVWESKDGDTVNGHYSVVEPDGSIRSVEYSAGPNTGFTAIVNNDGIKPVETEGEQDTGRSLIKDKTMREYGKYYDYAEEVDSMDDFFERKHARRPYDQYRETVPKKRPYYDQDPSEYTHAITIKHPHDEDSQLGPAHSHAGYNFDPNCKTKTKKERYETDSYANILELEQNKHKPFNYAPEPYKDAFEKYSDSSNYAFQRIKPYESYKIPKYEEERPEPLKYHFQSSQDSLRPDKHYQEDIIPSRPHKKRRPQKVPEYNEDEYILVPKKKYKPTRRPSEPIDHRPEFEDEFDRPYGYDDEDRYRPIRDGGSEVVRKVVKKKKKPAVNLLDIFDI